MKAPDKIYSVVTIYDYDNTRGAWSCVKVDGLSNTEYIRKDALLEWVKEKQEQMKIEAGGCSNMLAAGKLLAYGEIIEKIKSL